jgi:hypothetical protein
MHLAWLWFTGLASIRKFRITPRFPRTVMVGFTSRTYFNEPLRSLNLLFASPPAENERSVCTAKPKRIR